MIDHIGLAISDIARSRAFYEAALEPLGIRTLQTIAPSETESGGMAVMMGDEGIFFVIADNERPGEGTHVAFRASSRAQVDRLPQGRDRGGRPRQWRAGHPRPISSALLCGVRP